MSYEFNYSKSCIMTFYYCRWSFYKQYILKEKSAVWTIASEGTELHSCYEKFFWPVDKGGVDTNRAMDLDHDKDSGTYRNPVYNYFMSLLYSYIDDAYKSDGRLIMNLKSFAMHQSNRWRFLRYKYKEKRDIRRYFIPESTEQKYETTHPDIPRPLKGYIDAVMREPKTPTSEKERRVIVDYKTGGVPYPLRRELRIEPELVYSKDLPTKYSFEGNFYCLLYLLTLGYGFKINKNHLNSKGEPMYDLVHRGEFVKNVKWLDYAFMFTNGHKVFIGRRKCNINSMRKVMKKIADMEEFILRCQNGKQEWLHDDNSYKCPKCSWFVADCQYTLKDADLYKELSPVEDIEDNPIFDEV